MLCIFALLLLKLTHTAHKQANNHKTQGVSVIDLLSDIDGVSWVNWEIMAPPPSLWVPRDGITSGMSPVNTGDTHGL